MCEFEAVLKQYEPMISSMIRKLNIYRDHEQFRQAGRVALWQAWQRFDLERGSFTPFAYISIRGAMLDELKKQSQFEDQTVQMQDEILENMVDTTSFAESCWSEPFEKAFRSLKAGERELIGWLFVDSLSMAECATAAGISVAGVKKRRERVLSKIRDLLVEQ